MKKNSVVKIALLLSTLGLLAGCAGDGDGKGTTQIEFLYTGNTSTLKAFKNAADKYNETQGKEDNIKVLTSFVSTDGLDTKLGNVLISNKGPDVVVVEDTIFKKNCKNLEDLTSLIDSDKLADMYENQLYRYHYNTKTGVVSNNEPMYGVPAFNDTTVLYYNKTALEARGIKCISVEESELEAFNAGGQDHNGKTKADYGIDASFVVPNKGFYRKNNYKGNGNFTKFQSNSELAIFNERIACNWDEIEDVAAIMTKTKSTESTTQYGYYTEWWFNYGWSVGGDCLQDLSGNGDYRFTLASQLKNYIVTEGNTYTGLYSGKVYSAGETLEVPDIIDAQQGDTISDYTDERTTYYYTVNGVEASVARQDVLDKTEEGVLNELPSIETAFRRFCNLSGQGGIQVCPSPNEFTQTNSTSYFISKGVSFLVEKISNVENLKNVQFEYGVARMPMYKEYTTKDASNDTVKVKGKIASHSLGYCFSLRKGTTVKDASVKFVNWMISEGQKVFAEEGLASGRKSDIQLMTTNMSEKLHCNNTRAVADSLEGAKAGDWWYMPDRNWIDNWANPLNNQVRKGTLSYEAFLYRYITPSNRALEAYKNLLGQND